jgi:hypothetical protein
MRLFVIAIEERAKVYQRIKLALSGDLSSLDRLVFNLKFEAYSILGMKLPPRIPETPLPDKDRH